MTDNEYVQQLQRRYAIVWRLQHKMLLLAKTVSPAARMLEDSDAPEDAAMHNQLGKVFKGVLRGFVDEAVREMKNT